MLSDPRTARRIAALPSITAHFFNVSVDYLLGVSDIRYAFKTSFTRDELIAAEAVILTLLDMLRR